MADDGQDSPATSSSSIHKRVLTLAACRSCRSGKAKVGVAVWIPLIQALETDRYTNSAMDKGPPVLVARARVQRAITRQRVRVRREFKRSSANMPNWNSTLPARLSFWNFYGPGAMLAPPGYSGESAPGSPSRRSLPRRPLNLHQSPAQALARLHRRDSRGLRKDSRSVMSGITRAQQRGAVGRHRKHRVLRLSLCTRSLAWAWSEQDIVHRICSGHPGRSVRTVPRPLHGMVGDSRAMPNALQPIDLWSVKYQSCSDRKLRQG